MNSEILCPLPRAAGSYGILGAPPAFLTSLQSSAAGSTSAVQSDMGNPIDLKDSLIHRLRSVVKAARMSVDDIALEISDQVGIVEQPRVMLLSQRK